MHRFYSPESNLNSQKIIIKDKDEIHHIRTVLRLKANDQLFVFNNTGQEATGTITSISALRVEVSLSSTTESLKNTKPYIILASAIPKKSKFETIIEKCTELGVEEIIPLKTKRTEFLITDERRLTKKIERFQTVAINASKQSGRNTVPKIHPPMRLHEAIAYAQKVQSTCIIPSLQEKTKPIRTVLNNLSIENKISFFIGPEGDFTDKEYTLAREGKCIPVSLGETILKVETAAISVICFTKLFFLSDSN